MTLEKSYKVFLTSILCVGTLLFCGCGDSGPKLYTVKGVAKRNGKPVAFLYISFLPDNEQTKAASTGASDENGRFEMRIGGTPGVYPGEVTVTAHDPLIEMGSKSSTDPDYLEVIKKYAPGKSTMKLTIDKNMSDLQLNLD